MKIKENDIFIHTWGYDQTNTDFYQVVKTTPKMVHVRRIESQIVNILGPMQEEVIPRPGVWHRFSDVLKRKFTVSEYRGNPHVSININNCGGCHLWDGKQAYASHTH